MESNKLRTGHKVLINDEPYIVVDYTLRQQPRMVAKVILKLKNLITGNALEKTVTSGEDIPLADISNVSAQFLYVAGEEYSFMNNETYEQFNFSAEKLGDVTKYLTEGLEVTIMMWDGSPINVDVPAVVVLEVVETEPGLRGDTASGGTKPAKVETGITVQVPFFINVGDKLVINTLTGEYKERAKN